MKKQKQQIVIYRSKDKEVKLDVSMKGETVWLTQKQIAILFGVNVPAINKHVKNIFKDGELDEISTVSKMEIVRQEGKRSVKRSVELYNLDMIISVGYRVNSRCATQFRIWATQTLKKYVLDGFVINAKRLKERQFKKLKELEDATVLLQQTIIRNDLSNDEAKGLLHVITEYNQSWLLLHKYDKDTLGLEKVSKRLRHKLDYEEAQLAVGQLKNKLLSQKQISGLFGSEREKGLESILGNLYQSFGGKDLYPSIEEKAAHLLYFVIKNHPFSDGNKRIGAMLFIVFLARNNYLHTKKGEKKINDNALVTLALFIAESDPKQKDTMVRLVVNLINKR